MTDLKADGQTGDVAGDDVLTMIRVKLQTAEDQQGVEANVRRHYEHLENLAASLRKLGMDERDISDEILLIFHQYERALSDYIMAA